MDDKEFISNFENGKISKEDWTHREHVRMSFIYLQRNNLKDSTEKIRVGIKNLIKSQGVDKDQFHETLTLAWIRLVDTFIKKGPPAQNSEEFCKLNPQLLDWHSIYFFYSRDRIASKEARSTFLKPDLTDFPT